MFEVFQSVISFIANIHAGSSISAMIVKNIILIYSISLLTTVSCDEVDENVSFVVHKAKSDRSLVPMTLAFNNFSSQFNI